MGLARRILGPKSKYIKDLPYTYEAVVLKDEELDVKNTLVSDTICGLVEFMQADGLTPEDVEIREIRVDGDKLIDQALYVGTDGGWLARPHLCGSFEQAYPGHIRGTDCTFKDRKRDVLGG